MKVLEKHLAYAHWKDLNISYSYIVDQGVKLKKTVNINISGKSLGLIDDKDAGKLLHKLSLVVRGKDLELKDPEKC
jgi:hypothetical protein